MRRSPTPAEHKLQHLDHGIHKRRRYVEQISTMGIFDSIATAVLGSRTSTANGFLGFGGHSKPTTDAAPPPSSSDSSSDLSVPTASTTSQSSFVVESSDKLVQPGQFFKYGHPGPHIDFDFRQEYISAFDRRTRNPYYVIEHITPQSIAKNRGVDRKNAIFTENESIPAIFRAHLADYFRSGYDRGHMAPAANARFSQQAMNETFLLTNISPQIGDGFNRDYWAHLEDFCRRLTGHYNSVRIVTGPLYLPKRYPDGKFRVSYEVIGNPPNVAVPTHFYKLVVAEEPLSNRSSSAVAVGAFILPNEPISNSIDLKSFYVPVDAIERAAGLTFLADLPKSDRKDLCREVDCSIIVREFTKALPGSPETLALPAPRS
ncbi:uncharacterized protein V1518DRAFT_408919 [Limtongia smithiae]|uniref:uncharacterized protein n=1 Tax=Limtongia smithiae TaxID=1125753 RepID=UPI0034CE3E20